MSVGIYGKQIQLDPKLEAIRNEALEREKAARTNEFVLQLIRKTSRIHAGFLFEVAQKSLQDLCLSISESQSKISDSGWMEFGFRLGLSRSALRCINNHFNNDDPTYNTLLAFVQQENATVGKIIQALADIGRLDVISRIKDSVNELADQILQDQCSLGNVNSTESTSDYESLPTTDGRLSVSSGSTNSNIDNAPQEIIRPRTIPDAPFIFRNVQNQTLLYRNQNDSGSYFESFTSEGPEGGEVQAAPQRNEPEGGRQYESFQNAAVKTKNENEKLKQGTKKKHGKIIMLTFASDGEKLAKEICQTLRQERENLPTIGVLILQEHLELVNKDPNQFISGAFHQVDYVCPILTNQYFKIISRKESPPTSNNHIDAHYVQYIYSLMNSYYTSNGCLNDKIRCIIPDHIVSSIQCNLLMSSPIFSAWVKSSEVDDLAVRLLKSKA